MTLILITFAALVVGYVLGMYHRWLEDDCKWWKNHDKHLIDAYVDPQF